MSKGKNIVELETIKPDPLKKLFEALKEVLVDVNLIFEEDGMKISAMNNHKTALVYFKIEKSNLEHYSNFRWIYNIEGLLSFLNLEI